MIFRYVAALFAVLTITFAGHTLASAQYCGGTLEYVVRDQKGLLIEALDVEVLKNGPAPIHTYIRRPNAQALLDHEKEKLKRNGHHGPLIGRMPASDISDAGKANRKPSNIESLHLSTFAIRMGCGLPLVELSLRYKDDVMNLRFVNVIEMDAVLDALPFRSGTFEIDFRSVYQGMPGDRSNLNTTGLRNGDELLLTWHARGHALIGVKNWKKL